MTTGVVQTWKDYVERAEAHVENNHDRKKHDDDSCKKCYPPVISMAEAGYINFIQ